MKFFRVDALQVSEYKPVESGKLTTSTWCFRVCLRCHAAGIAQICAGPGNIRVMQDVCRPPEVQALLQNEPASPDADLRHQHVFIKSLRKRYAGVTESCQVPVAPSTGASLPS